MTGRVPLHFKCPECKQSFVRHFVRQRRKWCSEVCKVRAWRRRTAAKAAGEPLIDKQ